MSEINLNTRQKKVVQAQDSRILCLACAAAGKSRVLTERIRYVIEQGWCKPEDIVAITFTNQAASEMYSRLGKLGEKAFIGTIHSYANKLCTFNGLDTEQYIREEKFDKIIERAMTIPRDKLKPISYLFIDECQDLGDLEFNFLTYLSKNNEYWTGDDRQAIYGFKGATDKYLREMYDDPTYAKYFLVENYRNTPEIVDFAEGFLNGTEPLSPKTIPRKTKNGLIERCRFPEALEELEVSGNWGSWFIIARTNRDVYSIMEMLKEKEIPNTTFKRSELSIEEMESLMAENTVKVMTIHQCVSGDTLIPTSEGIIPISEIVQRKDKNLLVYNGSYYDTVKEFINNGEEETYKITSKYGSSIRITKNHDCIVLKEDGLHKIPAKELKIGDNILIRKDIENYQYKDIELIPTTKEDVNYNTIIYDTPKKLDANLAELIGMITADGTHNKLSIHYIKQHKECVDRFAELIKLCFKKEIAVKRSNESDSWFTECNSTFILDFLYKNFDGINNNDKFISSKILQANPKIQCAFLKGLFEDGSVQLKEGRVDNITLTFKNPKMLVQLQTLLFTLGIDASFATRTYNNKELNYCYIYSTGIAMYKEKIGFISKMKQDRLNTFVKKYQRKNKSSAFREMLLKEKEKLFITGYSRFWNNLKKNKSLTDGNFFDYYKLLNDEQKENPTVQLIKTVFEDYQVEEIVNIEKCEPELTYCLTMEHEPQFVQNGFLMGNSKGLESPNVIVVGALTYNKEERRIAYVAATRAETNLWWCPALKKEEGKLKEPNQSFKTNRQIQRAYGELIEF